MRYVVTIIISTFFISTILYADTVFMKDKSKIKGLIIEEYVDRITLNTVNGEENIFKEDIQKIEYDTPEQNFMQLGRDYDAKGRYDKAVFYYKKAMEVNPDYKEAKLAYLESHAKMWRQEESMTRKELEHRSTVMEWWKNRRKKNFSQEKGNEALLKDVLGISLVDKDGIFTINEVRPHSNADKAGIQEGDILVAIASKFIRYSKMEDVLEELLGPKYSEVRILIEREIFISVHTDEKNLYKELGVLLGFEYDGLVVRDVIAWKKGEESSFKKGDFVIAIDKNITRYLPLDSIIALINSAQDNKDIIFTIRRAVKLRRELE